MKVNFKIKLFLIMKKVISQEMDQKKKSVSNREGMVLILKRFIRLEKRRKVHRYENIHCRTEKIN